MRRASGCRITRASAGGQRARVCGDWPSISSRRYEARDRAGCLPRHHSEVPTRFDDFPISNVSFIAFVASTVYNYRMTALLELPSPETSDEAQNALRDLMHGVRREQKHVRLQAHGAAGRTVTVPRAAFDLFLEILGQMANGNAVTIVPVHAELTTQQAAEMLNVSRPHLVSLLESGRLPFRKVGTHRRVMFADIAAFKRMQDAQSREAAAELSRQAQELGLDY